MESFRQHGLLLQTNVVVAQVDKRVMPGLFNVPVLGKSLCRQTEHLQWISPQRTRCRSFGDLISPRRSLLHLLPSINEKARDMPLVVSCRQLFDLKLITLLDDSRQTPISGVSGNQNGSPTGEKIEA